MLTSPELVRIDVVRLVELYGSHFHSVPVSTQANSVPLFSRNAVTDELPVQGNGSNPSVRSIQAYSLC